jgi:hypothetical protein
MHIGRLVFLIRLGRCYFRDFPALLFCLTPLSLWSSWERLGWLTPSYRPESPPCFLVCRISPWKQKPHHMSELHMTFSQFGGFLGIPDLYLTAQKGAWHPVMSTKPMAHPGPSTSGLRTGQARQKTAKVLPAAQVCKGRLGNGSSGSRCALAAASTNHEDLEGSNPMANCSCASRRDRSQPSAARHSTHTRLLWPHSGSCQ